MLKSHKIMFAALVLLAVTFGVTGQQSAEARSVACGPHGCYRSTTVYRPTICHTPVCSRTHYVCYYDPGCCRWVTRRYANYYQAVGACNYLRRHGYRFKAWTRY